MAHYRFYFHDSRGHFLRSLERELEGDAQAMEQARALEHRHAVEVWQGQRKVGVVDSN
jgi:hypothetical protein